MTIMNFKKEIILLSLVFLIIFQGCKKSDQEQVNTNNNYDISYEITKVDSLTIKGSNLAFEDYRKNTLLFYNRSSLDVVSYNLKTQKSQTFNSTGSDFKSYPHIFKETIRFLNDSTIGISTIQIIKKYSLDGNYKGDILVKNNNTQAPLSGFNIFNDSILISLRAPQNDYTKKTISDSKHDLFIWKNLNNKDQERFGNFPIKGSDYINDKYYYPYPFEFFEYVNENEMIYTFINTNDKNIFTFDVKNKKRLSTRKINLENYRDVPIEFGKQQSMEENRYDIYNTGIIQNYFKFNDYEIVSYIEGHERDYVIDFAREHGDDFPRYERPTFKYSLHLLKGEKQYSSDFRIPESYGAPIVINSFDELIFQKNTTEEDENNDQTVLYICKLVKN